MKVQELAERINQRDEERIVVKLGDIKVADDASSIEVGDHSFYLDEQATATFAKYLKIPRPYLKSCTPEFRAETLRFWRDKHAEADTMIETVCGELVAIYSPHLLMLPLDSVVGVIESVFPADADVRTFIRDEHRFHVDITVPGYSATVNNPDGIPGRPEEGEDTTYAGVRMLVYPNQVKAPVVSTYLHRVHTGAGMTTDLKAGQVSLKGRTVSEVIDEMECAAEKVLSTVQGQLHQYALTATTAVPGTPLAFAMALAREAKLTVRVRDAVMDLINQLPEDAPVYDVNAAFTTVATRGVKYSTQLKLQELGGRLALDTKRVLDRCKTCEQLLVS